MPERASGLIFQEPPGTPAMEAALGPISSLEPQAPDRVVGDGFVGAPRQPPRAVGVGWYRGSTSGDLWVWGPCYFPSSVGKVSLCFAFLHLSYPPQHAFSYYCASLRFCNPSSRILGLVKAFSEHMVSWGRGLTPVVAIPMLPFDYCPDRNFEIIIINVWNYAKKNMDMMKRN